MKSKVVVLPGAGSATLEQFLQNEKLWDIIVA